jgi:chromosome segregation ATPase
MLSAIPKIATVVLALASVAFMGMAMAAYYGRPDPMAEITSPELANYDFEAPLVPDGSWSVTPAIGENKTASTHPNAYAAILDAYKKEGTRLSAESSEMSSLTTQLRARFNEISAEQIEDIAAMERRIQALQNVVAAADAEQNLESERFQKLSVDARAVRDETSRRREDVIRLQNELEELRTDRFRLEELRRILTDRLIRLELENQALDSRFSQFTQTTEQEG